MEGTLGIDILGLIAVAFLVLANAFFVAAEFSLVSVRRTRIAELIQKGDHSAAAVQKAIDDPDQVIAATQLGITLASLGLGWIGEPALAHLLAPIVSLFPEQIKSMVSHSMSAFIAFGIITFLHVVIGELMPKSIALQNPEKVSLFVAGPTLFTEKVFKPAIWALNGAGNGLLRLIGVQPAPSHLQVHSAAELRMLVTASTQGGVLHADEGQLLHAAINFGDLVVRQVMVPRTEILAVEADIRLEDIISLVSESTYTKFPVYEDDLDNIIGVVHIKDLLTAMQSQDCKKCVARDYTRDALYVPETIRVNALLHHFRINRQHIAIVLDEYGGTAGLVTLEDLLEEIVGEVSDPFDAVITEIQTLSDGTYLIDGVTRIEDVNEYLGLKLNDPNYDTIAGYVMGKLGRIPRQGDVVEADRVRLQVDEMDGMRIERLSLSRLNPNITTGKDTVQ